MEKVYIFGHQRPDTDAITAAITLSYLKNKQGMNTEPRSLGDINDETKFVLNKFNVKEPKYLNDVRLQLRDVSYHKGFYINKNKTIKEAYDFLEENAITGIPVVDDDNKLLGIVTLKDIVREIIGGDITRLSSTYENLINTINGEKVYKNDDHIEGNLIIASYKSQTFFDNIHLSEKDILIVGDRNQIHENAINNHVKLLIVTGNGKVLDEHIALAKKNKVNIIRTPFDSFHTSKLIGYSNNIGEIVKDGSVSFKETDFYDDFLDETKKLKHNNYPIVDSKGTCLGLIRITDITEKNNKKVILVDHQELEQSVYGIEEAEIIEIVDHHKIGSINTSMHINFRNMIVGSSCTIVYTMYKETS